MRKVLAWLVLAAAVALPAAAKEPCAFTVAKHERHTTTAQKKEAYRRAGIAWKDRGCCVVDHIVSLELGGLDDVSNFQIQTKAEGHAKDLVENFLARCVCQGDTSLAVAQKAVVKWKSVTLGTCPKEAP